jgi:hypothetical protein
MPSSPPRRNCRVRLSRLFPCNTGLPRLSVGSASTSMVSGPHRTFTCVTACIFAGPPHSPFHRRLRRIRYLLRRFDCYWASDPSQAGLPPARLHTPSRRTDRPISVERKLGQSQSCSAPLLLSLGRGRSRQERDGHVGEYREGARENIGGRTAPARRVRHLGLLSTRGGVSRRRLSVLPGVRAIPLPLPGR